MEKGHFLPSRDLGRVRRVMGFCHQEWMGRMSIKQMPARMARNAHQITVWAAAILSLGLATSAIADVSLSGFQPVIMAGTATGTPTDSPAKRIDPNTTSSIYAGVGSLVLAQGGITYLSTAVAIDRWHILTAAHSLDAKQDELGFVRYDGRLSFAPGDVRFNLNFGGSLTHQITASSLLMHPGYEGFSDTTLTHDDIALIKLASPLPEGVPVYSLYEGTLALGAQITMVGYGHSGYGDVGWGFDNRASVDVKRVGYNNVDVFVGDNNGGPLNEIFLFDFDGPNAEFNHWGGRTLGNDIESQLGFGDSGGPSFIMEDGELRLVGINTFLAMFANGPSPPLFDSAGGGMLISGYHDWILQNTPAPGAALLGFLGLSMVPWVRRRLGG